MPPKSDRAAPLSATVFELRDRDGLGRLGRFTTPHGTVDTPTLLPVINPNQVLIPPAEMRSKFGAQGVITNAYILHRSMRERALAEGVHGVLGFDGPIITDSVAFQRDTRADIGPVLDRFSEPAPPPARAEKDIEETLLRTRVATEMRGGMLLAGAVQGSIYPDLRHTCAEELSK